MTTPTAPNEGSPAYSGLLITDLPELCPVDSGTAVVMPEDVPCCPDTRRAALIVLQAILGCRLNNLLSLGSQRVVTWLIQRCEEMRTCPNANTPQPATLGKPTFH